MSSLAQHATDRSISVASDAAVELHAADRRQVVTLFVEEQVVEQVLGGVFGRRFAGTHHAIDLDQRFEVRCWSESMRSVSEMIRTAIEIVGVQRFDAIDAGLGDTLAGLVGAARSLALRQDFAGSPYARCPARYPCRT